MVRGECSGPQHRSLQQRGLLFVRSGFHSVWSGRFVATAVRRWSPTQLCGALGCVHLLSVRVFIAASGHGVILGFVQHRWAVIVSRVSLCRLTSLTGFLCFMCCAFRTLPHEPLLSLSHAASLHVALIATFRLARLTLGWVGVAVGRDARHACLRSFSFCFHGFPAFLFISCLFFFLLAQKSKKKKTRKNQKKMLRKKEKRKATKGHTKKRKRCLKGYPKKTAQKNVL